MPRKTRTTPLALAAALLLGGTALAGAADGPIKIGFVTTLTTPAGVIGKDMVDAVNLAIEHAGGKIAGRDIKLIVEDDGVRPDTGRQKVDRLLKEEGVDVVAGFIWSDVLLASQRAVLDAGKLLVSTNAGPSQLAGKDCAPGFFALRAQNDVSPMSLGDVMNAQGVKKLYVMVPNYAAGQDMAAGVKRTFKGEVLGEDYTKWGRDPQLDFQAELAKAKASGADAIFAFYPGRAGPAFLKQFDNSGMADRVKLYTVYTIDETGLPRLKEADIGSALKANLTEFWTADLDTPANKRFVTDFRAKYGRYPSYYAAAAYELVPFLKAGIEANGGDATNTPALRAALAKLSYDSVRGPYSLGANHFAVNPYYLAKAAPDADGNWRTTRVEVATKALTDPYAAECKMPSQ